MRRATGLLIVLLGLAVLSLGLLRAFDDNCGHLEREARASVAALDVCANTMGCQFHYHDIIDVAQQQRAARRCKASEEITR